MLSILIDPVRCVCVTWVEGRLESRMCRNVFHKCAVCKTRCSTDLSLDYCTPIGMFVFWQLDQILRIWGYSQNVKKDLVFTLFSSLHARFKCLGTLVACMSSTEDFVVPILRSEISHTKLSFVSVLTGIWYEFSKKRYLHDLDVIFCMVMRSALDHVLVFSTKHVAYPAPTPLLNFRPTAS